MDAAATRRWLLRVMCCALVLRLLAACGLQLYLDSREPPRRFLIEGDAEGYWDLAGDIAHGDDYAVYTPPRRVLRMPGFPAVLAVPRLVFGDRLFPARLWLAVIGTLACWGVWKLGAVLVDDTIGLIAAGLAAVSPVPVLFSPVELSETTFAAAMLVSLIGAARLMRRHGVCSFSPQVAEHVQRRSTLPLAAVTGLGVALATYVRPSWLLVGPLFAAVLVCLSPHKRLALRDGTVVSLVLLAALLPWGLRNRQATGHFVLTTLWMGPSLYDGLNPEATGDSNMAFFDRDNLLSQGQSEFEVNDHYRQAAWQYAFEHPQRALELAVAKFWRFWKPWPNAAQFRHWPALLGAAGSFLLAVGLAVIGAWRARRDRVLLLIAGGPIAYFCAVHLFFVSSLRYRLPAEYPLLVLSAVGLRAIYCRDRGAISIAGVARGEA